MLNKLLLAASLLIASGSALADRDDYVYGRVLSVEPSFSVSIGGGRYNDGFRYVPPRDVIYLPRPVYAEPVYRSYYREDRDWDHRGWDHRGWDRGWHRGWRDHDRHDGDWGHGRHHDDD
jgi:hypothetical protein